MSGCYSQIVFPLLSTRRHHHQILLLVLLDSSHSQKKGYKALKKYVWQRTSVAMRLGRVSSNQRVYVAGRAKDAMDRVCFVTKRRDELLKCRTGAEGPQAEAFLQRADALDLQIPPLARHAEVLIQGDYALGRQQSAICRLRDAYVACFDYFEQMCKRLCMDAVLVEE